LTEQKDTIPEKIKCIYNVDTKPEDAKNVSTMTYKLNEKTNDYTNEKDGKQIKNVFSAVIPTAEEEINILENM